MMLRPSVLFHFSTKEMSRTIRYFSTITNNSSYIRQAILPPSSISSPELGIYSTPSNVILPPTKKISYTSTLTFLNQLETDKILSYRVLQTNGQSINADHVPKVTKEFALKMYTDMLTLNLMDLILNDAQRQGRISFYLTHWGEEATLIGSAAALSDQDEVFAQYREAGVLLYRGFSLNEFMNQVYSNNLDYGKGKQMPIHYGSTKYHFQTVSSPLATQIPQAAGAAYALKRDLKPNCSVCYFGDGASSEGDFHAGLNFASTLGCPVIFLCRNNGFAISTPVHEQYRGDGIVSRGAGYGIASIRVDGNDIWAVYNAVKAARELALQEKRPVLVEAMSYRIGHHSTSDDSSAYRAKKEVEEISKLDNPVHRFYLWLLSMKWWTPEEEKLFKSQRRSEVLEAFNLAEKLKKPAISELFTDVYNTLTPQLKQQQAEMEETIKMYPEQYPTADHEKSK